ncbi:DUF3093 domain-containing protein [Streptomyces sp. NBC_00237]|uniref:DUF3093 domain-containing protein n=1 Tax=Streptomyces sp. NBC_00237 TaxID=2975687 RepID=UPI002251F100|nr:DUF3093 domain-containing protein [Streptomyces sp. NBC_00237]MCX5203637.1 DUF3093 domain-containing protein [Streptomyces sp. NBC_00237]
MQSYEERLTAPRSWWFITVGVGIACGLMLLPVGPLPMLGAVIVGILLSGALVSSYGSVRIRVVAGSLVAGDARIPVSALGDVEVLDAEEARAWRTHKADLRAFMLLRSYIPTAVRIPVTDPDDPTPYAYLSTRHPQALADVLAAARATDQPLP